MALGIAFDIGAYACKAAILRGETLDPEHLLYGDKTLRSVVYVDKRNKIIVGEKAIERAAIDPRRAFFNVKRRILRGDRQLPDIPELTYIDLYVALIREVIARCNKQLKKNGDTIDHVVLTIPSYPEDRNEIIAEIKRAAESIEVAPGKCLSVELLIEPAGVAIHNLNALTSVDAKTRQHTQIIYDLGHSTLDVALVSTQNNEDYSNVLHHFRPDDETFCAYFDECIAQRIEEQLVSESVHITDRIRRKIMDAAAEMKHELSSNNEHTVNIYCSDVDDIGHSFTLTREQFEEMVISCLRNSTSLVTEALEIAEEKGLQVDEIILAGGGSSIPLVERCIREVAGNIPVKRSLQPIDAISYGASRYCLTHNLQQKSKLAYGLQLPVNEGTIIRKVQFMAPEGVSLPFKSAQLTNDQFVCTPEGVYRTVLYSHTHASVDAVIDADNCKQVRHMMFSIAPNQSVSFFMEIDEEHCVKIICQTQAGERYVMTSFDPANAVSRKE